MPGKWKSRRYRRRRRWGKKRKTGVKKQVERNKRAIDRLEDATETKYLTRYQASGLLQYAGQLAVFSGVDCFGNINQLQGLNKYDPSTTGTVPISYNFQPALLQPLRCIQGVSEGQRVGEFIKMKWLNLKGTVSAYAAQSNGTNSTTNVNFASKPAIQRVKMLVILDKNPPKQALATQTAYDWERVPCTLYDSNFPAGYGPNPLPNIRPPVLRNARQPFTGPVLAAADGTSTIFNTSYWSNDHVTLSKQEERRFKILKVVNFKPVQQENAQNAPNTLPSKRNFSVTIKAPYKFQYPNPTSQLPTNQNILVMFVSDSNVPIGAADSTPNVCLPEVICQAKIAYSDL